MEENEKEYKNKKANYYLKGYKYASMVSDATRTARIFIIYILAFSIFFMIYDNFPKSSTLQLVISIVILAVMPFLFAFIALFNSIRLRRIEKSDNEPEGKYGEFTERQNKLDNYNTYINTDISKEAENLQNANFYAGVSRLIDSDGGKLVSGIRTNICDTGLLFSSR